MKAEIKFMIKDWENTGQKAKLLKLNTEISKHIST